MSARVYVTQRPARFSQERGGWVNKYDLSPAREFGDLVYLLPPRNIYNDGLGQAIAKIKTQLKHYTPNDHIMALGDPLVIAVTVMIAASKTNGVVSLLKWDRIENRYRAFLIDIRRRKQTQQ